MDDSISTLPMDEEMASSTASSRFSTPMGSSNFNNTKGVNCDGGTIMENINNQGVIRKKSMKRYSVVDRRHHQKQNTTEQKALLGGDKDDSDLEQNIGRLCQYLSGSEEDGDEEENRQDLDDAIRHSSNAGSAILQRPAGLFLLNSRYQKRSIESVTPPSSLVSDENCNCAISHGEPSTMPTQHESELFSQGIPMQRLVPRDFLNIPPPAQPPPAEDSPAIDRPLPPQRTLPPLPDEPLYEEAKPAPPPPMPRPSKQTQVQQKNGPLCARTPNSAGKASAVVSPVMASSYHAAATASCHRDEESPARPLCLSQGSQYNDIDCWHNYETSILERNEAGSFYIPSGQTTMSSISPSRKSEIDQHKQNNYLLTPAATTTIPVPVLPTRQDGTAVNHKYRHRLLHPKANMPVAFDGKRNSSSVCCSWKCLTYLLAATLIFVLAVVSYLLYLIYSSNSLNSTPSPSAPPHLIHGTSSHFGYSTASSSSEFSNQHPSAATLRPVPESFALGDDVVADLIPGHLARTYFTIQRNSHVQFNVTLESQTRMAIYGRQTLPASPTQYDFMQIVHGAKVHTRRFDGRTVRAVGDLKHLSENLRSTTFMQYLSGGKWHLSILNDDNDIRTVRFSASLTVSEKEECKNNCHNKGLCKERKCYCFNGYTGPYCEETFCPVLCSGNGIFSSGKCHCHHGWKGADCEVPANVCEVPNCNGHGQCSNKGECVCDKSYGGSFCEQRECPHRNCSGHGVCYNGKCYCNFGYKGERCDVVFTSADLCPLALNAFDQCNGRGRVDLTSGFCNCEDGWLGDQCEKRICHTNCGQHGKCINDACACDDGFSGDKCELLACAPGCEDNGRCVNGTCLCKDGWNGEACQLAGCPNACNQHGQCKKINNQWRCECVLDFAGEDCTIPIERQCSDNIDNDGDGLLDCEDSECCRDARCKSDQYCRTVPDPYQVLVRKESISPQASFYQKTAFLLDSESVQQYGDSALFSQSRMSVVRGRVVNSKGGALMAVRIANAANALFGFTLSRAAGYFDLAVDGGGSVTLQFMRKPFTTNYVTVVVPWNQIVYIGDVVMLRKDESAGERDNQEKWSDSCLDAFKNHNVKPFAVPSWRYGRNETTSSTSGVMADAAAVQETLRIPGTDIFLVYTSANAIGRESTLSLYLVPATSPKNLRLVRLAINVEGIHFETTLEAKANLSYVYGWNKTNVYKQRVTGLAAAQVKVGYVYAACDRIFWETLNVKLNGNVASISEIGGWNLNIHHRYNILDNVVERGDGGATYLREELSVLISTVGTKEQRPLTCASSSCNGPVSSAQLYLPMAIATSRDGSVYIGDYNFIRRLVNGENLVTVLELSISDMAHRYYLAVHPITGELYVSLPLRRQIWKIRSLSPSSADLSTNYNVAVGSGEICSVDSDCGDGASAELALLTYPKGIAFDSYGNLYIADDRRIRSVSTTGFVSTIIGSPPMSDHFTSVWQPLQCSTIYASRLFRPQWPTSLTFDFNSGNLAFLDTDIIFELTAGGNFIRIRAGAPSHCSQLLNGRNETVRPTFLKGATSISFADDGKILVAETDRKRMHRIRSFDRYGRDAVLAEADSKCDCHRRPCQCDDDGGTTKLAHLQNPTSLAVDENGNVHVADEKNLKIQTLKFVVPTLDSTTRLYEIASSNSQEIYYFNRLGQHVSTKDIVTGKFIHNFTYHVDTSYGKLNHVSGAGGLKINILRKSARKIFIENTHGPESVAHVYDGMLEKFVSPNGAETQFNYSRSGLLIGKTDSTKQSWSYEYDSYGRLKWVNTPTGNSLFLKYGLFGDRPLVDVTNKTGHS